MKLESVTGRNRLGGRKRYHHFEIHTIIPTSTQPNLSKKGFNKLMVLDNPPDIKVSSDTKNNPQS